MAENTLLHSPTVRKVFKSAVAPYYVILSDDSAAAPVAEPDTAPVVDPAADPTADVAVNPAANLADQKEWRR